MESKFNIKNITAIEDEKESCVVEIFDREDAITLQNLLDNKNPLENKLPIKNIFDISESSPRVICKVPLPKETVDKYFLEARDEAMLSRAHVGISEKFRKIEFHNLQSLVGKIAIAGTISYDVTTHECVIKLTELETRLKQRGEMVRILNLNGQGRAWYDPNNQALRIAVPSEHYKQEEKAIQWCKDEISNIHSQYQHYIKSLERNTSQSLQAPTPLNFVLCDPHNKSPRQQPVSTQSVNSFTHRNFFSSTTLPSASIPWCQKVQTTSQGTSAFSHKKKDSPSAADTEDASSKKRKTTPVTSSAEQVSQDAQNKMSIASLLN